MNYLFEIIFIGNFGEYWQLDALYIATEFMEKKLLSPSLSETVFSSRNQLIFSNALSCLNYSDFQILMQLSHQLKSNHFTVSVLCKNGL